MHLDVSEGGLKRLRSPRNLVMVRCTLSRIIAVATLHMLSEGGSQVLCSALFGLSLTPDRDTRPPAVAIGCVIKTHNQFWISVLRNVRWHFFTTTTNSHKCKV